MQIWEYFGGSLVSFWGLHPRVTFGVPWGWLCEYSEITLGVVRGHYEGPWLCFGSNLRNFKEIWETFWRYSGVTLELLWSYFEDHFGKLIFYFFFQRPFFLENDFCTTDFLQLILLTAYQTILLINLWSDTLDLWSCFSFNCPNIWAGFLITQKYYVALWGYSGVIFWNLWVHAQGDMHAEFYL